MANYWSKGQEGKAKKYVSRLRNKEQKAFGLAYLNEKFNNVRVNLKEHSIMSCDEIQDIVEIIDKFLPDEKEESRVLAKQEKDLVNDIPTVQSPLLPSKKARKKKAKRFKVNWETMPGMAH